MSKLRPLHFNSKPSKILYLLMQTPLISSRSIKMMMGEPDNNKKSINVFLNLLNQKMLICRPMRDAYVLTPKGYQRLGQLTLQKMFLDLENQKKIEG